MTATQWKPVISASLAILSGTSIFCGVLLAILLNWNYKPRYVVIDPESHFAEQLSDDSFVVGRTFRVTSPTEFHMTRELVKVDEGVTTRVEMPDVSVFYEPGLHRVDRVQPLPSVKPGVYQYYNHLCWSANVLRTVCLDLPVLDLKVEPEKPS